MLHIDSRILILLVVFSFGPVTTWAGAVLFIYPTLVMFEGNSRSATITLTNRGDANGTFETSWSELTMTPEGGLLRVEGDVPWSVQPYVRYSPRRVTLEPAESQVIKIALRRDMEAPEGEYHSHFRVLTLNSEDLADESEDPANESEEAAAPPTSDSAVTITARSAVAIPIIWRNSKVSPGATIEAVNVNRDTNQLTVDVRRHGNVSVRGYLHVLGEMPDGTEGALAEPVPLVIYPSLETRAIAITLNEGITAETLASNTQVVYATDMDVVSDETILASYPIEP
jgi:P pilus assembly chaperone PapD